MAVGNVYELSSNFRNNGRYNLYIYIFLKIWQCIIYFLFIYGCVGFSFLCEGFL